MGIVAWLSFPIDFVGQIGWGMITIAMGCVVEVF